MLRPACHFRTEVGDTFIERAAFLKMDERENERLRRWNYESLTMITSKFVGVTNSKLGPLAKQCKSFITSDRGAMNFRASLHIFGGIC